MSDMHLISLPRLQAAMHLVVRGFGSSADEVAAVAGNLIEANLTGHDSHGIGMLPRYADAFLQGGLRANAAVSTVLDAGALLRLDGVQLLDPQGRAALQFKPSQPLLLQGQQGLSRKGPDARQASYYYSQPQLATRGQITLRGQRFEVSGKRPEPSAIKTCASRYPQ